MAHFFNPIIFLFTVRVLLIPAGLLLAVRKRKHKGLLVLGIVLMVAGIPNIGSFFLWQFDALRGWKLRLSAVAPPYKVTLVQEPGFDFYYTYLMIEKPDGKVAKVVIDGDDSRWWNPAVVDRNGKLYFVRGSGEIGDRTLYIDSRNDIVYTGYYQVPHRISDLCEFRESQNNALEQTAK